MSKTNRIGDTKCSTSSWLVPSPQKAARRLGTTRFEESVVANNHRNVTFMMRRRLIYRWVKIEEENFEIDMTLHILYFICDRLYVLYIVYCISYSYMINTNLVEPWGMWYHRGWVFVHPNTLDVSVKTLKERENRGIDPSLRNFLLRAC